jgi:hypothetical protein
MKRNRNVLIASRSGRLRAERKIPQNLLTLRHKTLVGFPNSLGGLASPVVYPGNGEHGTGGFRQLSLSVVRDLKTGANRSHLLRRNDDDGDHIDFSQIPCRVDSGFVDISL